MKTGRIETAYVAPVGDFAEKVRMARIKAGMFQRDVADLVGRTPNTVARWERGERQPEPLAQGAILALIAKARRPGRRTQGKKTEKVR